MHELGLVYQVVKTVDEVVKKTVLQKSMKLYCRLEK